MNAPRLQLINAPLPSSPAFLCDARVRENQFQSLYDANGHPELFCESIAFYSFDVLFFLFGFRFLTVTFLIEGGYFTIDVKIVFKI